MWLYRAAVRAKGYHLRLYLCYLQEHSKNELIGLPNKGIVNENDLYKIQT